MVLKEKGTRSGLAGGEENAKFSLSDVRMLWSASGRFQPIEAQPVVNQKQEEQLLTQFQEEGQVTVHVHFLSFPGALIRIWPTTYLIPSDVVTDKIPMVLCENISLAPVWTRIEGIGLYSFSLVFGALPQACSVFSLVEEIEESGAFHFKDIVRNSTDVYHLWL